MRNRGVEDSPLGAFLRQYAAATAMVEAVRQPVKGPTMVDNVLETAWQSGCQPHTVLGRSDSQVPAAQVWTRIRERMHDPG